MSRRARVAAIVFAALTVLAGVPATASSTLTVSYAAATGALVQGDGAREAAILDMVSAPETIRVRPSLGGGSDIPAAALAAGPGCALRANPPAVECSPSGSRLVTANLGADNDLFRAAEYTADVLLFGEDGNDNLTGGPGFDRIDGGAGNDHLIGGSGNDQVTGGPGDDSFTGDFGGTDTLLGEAGNDRFRAVNLVSDPFSPDRFDGGTGTDAADYSQRSVSVTLTVTVIGAGANDDGSSGEGDGLANVETLMGGLAGDRIEVLNSGTRAAVGTRTLLGNGGFDKLKAIGNVAAFLDGGLGRDSVIGGSAADTIFSREGEPDVIRCGAGLDTLKPDLRDEPISADCENIDQSDRREDRNVAIRNRSVAVDADGLLAVRLACPRSVAVGCRGVLSARLDRSGTRFGAGERYSLRRGRSVVVEVELRAGQDARARRRGARVRVRSVERGLHGPKTTLRSLPSRRG